MSGNISKPGATSPVRLLGERHGVIERIVLGHVPLDWERTHVARYEWAVRRLRHRAAATVLDVASGTGYGSRIIQRAGYRVVSVELSLEALRFGRESYALPCCVRANAQDLPFRSASFAAVVSLETIEHLAEPRQFLNVVRRALRPGGVLLLSSPNGALSSGTNPHHLNELTLEQLTRLLGLEGFGAATVYGQHCHVAGRHRYWSKIRGLRWLEGQVSGATAVRRFRGVFETASVWCVEAVAEA